MKRILMLIAIIALAMTKVLAYTEVAGFDGPTWYDLREDITQGNGSESSPYLISTPGQLAQLAYSVNVEGSNYKNDYFRLAADINLNARMENKRVLWVPIGNSTTVFNGTLTNPDGYMITDMLINATSSATTADFGLFGQSNGTLDGIKLENAEINLTNVSGDYNAGLLCGKVNKESHTMNCTVEGQQGGITATGISGEAGIGGLVGYNYSQHWPNPNQEFGRIQGCIARAKITLEGTETGKVYAGGVIGQSYGCQYDCHAVVNMTATGFTTEWSALGGLIGYTRGGVAVYCHTKYCSAAGDIVVDADSKTRTGGFIGWNQNTKSEITYCANTVAISGGHTLGGFIGYCYRRGSQSTFLKSNVCGSYIDGRDATYVGGILGEVMYLVVNSYDWEFSFTDGSWSNFFIGTMTRPTDTDGRCGVILGHAEHLNKPESLGYFGYMDYMCNLPLSGDGLDLSNNVYAYNGASSHTEGQYDVFCWTDGDGMIHPEESARALNDLDSMCYTDIYRLCALQFYIKNDGRTLFPAYDVTVDFSIEDMQNSATGERVAVITVPDDVTCVRVDGKHLYPLDPGEVTLTVKWNGLEKKVHFDITYGLDWAGDSDENFDGGDGTADNPYIIHNAAQLHAATHTRVWDEEQRQYVFKYNKAGVYFKLAGDIFLNTHLLQADGSPRSDAQTWLPMDFHATLDGNGHTIYGLYVSTWAQAIYINCGLFANLYGTVQNLAIIDSYVRAASSSDATTAGLLCGTMKEGASVTNCLLHGTVLSNGKAGAVAGGADTSGTSLTDCFANVHIGWADNSGNYAGAGIVYDAPAVLTRCFFTGRVDGSVYGLTSNATATDSYFDSQMMASDGSSQTGAKTTAEILASRLMAGNRWTQANNRYPMLTTFAASPYGKLLAMPVSFDDGDRAGAVTYIFDFPTNDVSWSALHGQQYIDVINDCGAASLVSPSGDNTEMLIAQAENAESQCTRAMRTLPLNIRAGLTDFRFKDPVARSAALQAFDANGDGIVILRELAGATTEMFQNTFNPNAAGLQHFPEMRYFTTVTDIENGMLSGLSSLSELQLPKRLTTLSREAFSGCDALTELTLPATFTTVSEGALYGSAIQNILVDDKNPSLLSISGVLYEEQSDGRHLVAYPPGRGEADATISTTLSTIDPYAFYRVPQLRNIYIDNALPEGNLVWADDNSIIHEEDTELMHIYVSDGSYNSQLYEEYEYDPLWGEYFDADHLHIYHPLTITSAGWATLYIGFPTQLPEGCSAYIVTTTDAQANTCTLRNIGRAIPATTPVVIGGEAGTYPLCRYDGPLPDLKKYENRLIGTFIGQEDKWGIEVNQETSVSGSILSLGRNSQGDVGFYFYRGERIPPYRAYLTANSIAYTRGFVFNFANDTGIANPQNALPQPSESVYNLQGQRIKRPQRGINIINGRKVFRAN